MRVMVWGLGGIGLVLLLAGCAWVAVSASVATPAYRVIETAGAIEIRDYPPLLAAEVTTTGERDQGVRAGFRPLANYIFAKDRAGEKVAMTAPVTQVAVQGAEGSPVTQDLVQDTERAPVTPVPVQDAESGLVTQAPVQGADPGPAAQQETIAMTAPVTQTEAGKGWAVRFLMPEGYTEATLPRPGSKDIRIVSLPASRVAAIRFSGWWDDASFQARDAELRGWLAARGLPATGPATFAYYNDPFTPGFLRRNEVQIGIGAAD